MGASNSSVASRSNLTTQNIINECGGNDVGKNLNTLVTGATSGIGIETARALALAGAKVFLLGRSDTKLKQVIEMLNKDLQQKSSNGSVHGVVADLNSLASIKQCAEKLIQENVPLNSLILNAGVFNYNFAQTVDGLEQVMGVNHIGHAYLTKLLMPTLIANAPSRIVVVSSELHSGAPLDYNTLEHMSSNVPNAKKGFGMVKSYQQSKLANVLFVRALASRYGEKQITAYSLHPGVIDTNLTSNLPLAKFVQIFFKKKTVEQGAATSVYCSLKAGIESESGRYFNDSSVTNVADKWSENDINTLWEWTEKIINERTANL